MSNHKSKYPRQRFSSFCLAGLSKDTYQLISSQNKRFACKTSLLKGDSKMKGKTVFRTVCCVVHKTFSYPSMILQKEDY